MKKDKYFTKTPSKGGRDYKFKKTHNKKVKEDVAHLANVGTQSVSESTRIKDNPAHNTSTDNSNIISSNNKELGVEPPHLDVNGIPLDLKDTSTAVADKMEIDNIDSKSMIGNPSTLLVEELLTAVNEIKEKMATKEFVDTMVGDSILAYHNKIYPQTQGDTGTANTGSQEFTSTVANGPMQPTTGTGTPPVDNQINNPGSKSGLGSLHDVLQVVVDGIKVVKETMSPPQDPQVYAIGKMGLNATENIMAGIVKDTIKKRIGQGWTPPHMEADH